MTDKILEETLELLEGHNQKGHSAFDTFCRLIFKSKIGENPPFYKPNSLNIAIEEIKSDRHKRSAKELFDLKASMIRSHHRKYENNSKNIKEMPPVILIEYDGKEYLIDGSHRINYWYQKDQDLMMRVNLHKIQ